MAASGTTPEPATPAAHGGPATPAAHGGPADPERQGQLLLELAARISSSLDLQNVLDESLAALRELVDFGGGAIQLVVDDVLVAAATDPPMKPEARSVRIPLGQGVSGSIAASGRPVYIPDITCDERVNPQGRKRGVSTGVRSYFGVPLIVRGKPIGVLQVDAPQVDAFGPGVRGLVLAFVPTIAAAVQNARLYERERAAADHLRETEQLKRDFLSIVSHELRTPLTSLLGFARTLAERGHELPAATAVDLGQRMTATGERLERLIGDLLQTARIERGLLEVSVRPTGLDPILRQFVASWNDPDHQLEVDLDVDEVIVHVDVLRIEQVLSNLLGNAAKYAPAGTPIELTARRSGDRVTVAVRDHGPGVPESVQRAVFGLFVQAERAETRSAGGLGIGLYVVERLCSAMGVHVAIETPEDGGARVVLSLPRAGPI